MSPENNIFCVTNTGTKSKAISNCNLHSCINYLLPYINAGDSPEMDRQKQQLETSTASKFSSGCSSCKMYSKVAVLLGVCALVVAEDCSKKFKEDDKHAKISDKCVETLKINPNDMPKTEEDFLKTFDDKVICY